MTIVICRNRINSMPITPKLNCWQLNSRISKFFRQLADFLFLCIIYSIMPKKKLKIGVLMGGPSAEHEVSLATGKNVIDNLDKTKYAPVAVKLSKTRSTGSGQAVQWFVNGRLTDMPKALKSCDLI